MTSLESVDGNPRLDFKTLYPFGTIRRDPETGEIYRTRGIPHTIKDGIVIENDRMLEEIERIVAESWEGAEMDVVREPFVAPTRGGVSDGGGGRRL